MVVVLVFVAVEAGPGGDGGSLARHVLVIAPSSHLITVMNCHEASVMLSQD